MTCDKCGTDMSELLYTEQLMWVRQEKARARGQNFMKLSPNDIELLLNTIRAERCLNENLTKERDAARADLECLRDSEICAQRDARIAHEDAGRAREDALMSYAEFYQRCATLAGLPDNCNPCSEADEIIASKIDAHDTIETLRVRVSELVEQANSTYAPYRQMVIDARAEVDTTSQKLFETRTALHNLVEACHRADNAGDLSSEIDGELMDEAWRVLKE